jgi:hypothetical protein
MSTTYGHSPFSGMSDMDEDRETHHYTCHSKYKDDSFGLNFILELPEYRKNPPISRYSAIARSEVHTIVVSKRNLEAIK